MSLSSEEPVYSGRNPLGGADGGTEDSIWEVEGPDVERLGGLIWACSGTFDKILSMDL